MRFRWATIAKELGPLPSDPFEREAWEHGVKSIEGYRRNHGITDKHSALGHQSKDTLKDTERRAAEASLRKAQRMLGRERQLAKSRERGIGIERSLRIGR